MVCIVSYGNQSHMITEVRDIFITHIHRAGWYSETFSVLIKNCHGFLQPLQANAGTVPRLCHNPLLPSPFQITFDRYF
jgi:hypothetical protein